MRRHLLALLFCLTAWAIPAHLLLPAADTTTNAAADVSSEAEAGAPQGGSDADSWWAAGHRATVSVTASRWKSSTIHADLAAARSRVLFIETDPVVRCDRPTRGRSPHLLHTPLLI